METISLMSMSMMEFERGPRYHAYAQLRETKIRMRHLNLRQEEYQEEEEEVKVLTPPRKKQVKFQAGVFSGRKGSSSSSSLLAQSVPDFSSVLRKENRKPINGGNILPPLMELTPPSKSGCGSGSASARGSKSANAGEKRRGAAGVLMPRKSYASIDELKSFSSATTTANAHNNNNRPRTTRLITRKTLLGYTHI